jgi:hypothetical protein
MRPIGLIPKLIKHNIVCNIYTRMYTTEHSEMTDTLNLLRHWTQNNGSTNHDWAMPLKPLSVPLFLHSNLNHQYAQLRHILVTILIQLCPYTTSVRRNGTWDSTTPLVTHLDPLWIVSASNNWQCSLDNDTYESAFTGFWNDRQLPRNSHACDTCHG